MGFCLVLYLFHFDVSFAAFLLQLMSLLGVIVLELDAKIAGFQMWFLVFLAEPEYGKLEWWLTICSTKVIY